MSTASLPLIDVDRLRLGMYVVLDVGWRNHPFAFSSFTLRTDEQLQQLRTLGPRQVRYSPERSTAEPLPADQATAAATSAGKVAGDAAIGASAALRGADPLTVQLASLHRVEADWRDAAQQHQRIIRSLLTSPLEARGSAERLADTLLRTVTGHDDLTVRLLTGQAGFQPSGHEVAVTALALLLGRECGFDTDRLRELALAALLHDIGKARLPAFLHEDHGRLTAFERGTYRRHVELGVELAEAMALPRPVVRAIAQHHERFDGSGFPSGIAGDLLSPVGRVLAIVNRYHGLVCPLRVEAGMTPHQALQRMYATERSQHDPVFLPRFVRMMGVYPPGTLVELTDRRMAIVIAARPGMALAPRVQPMETVERDEPAALIDLDPESGPRIRCSVRPEQLNARWARRAAELARAPLFLESVAPAASEPRAAAVRPPASASLAL